MPVIFKTAAGQAAFTTETQHGDYAIEYPLGAAEPTALLIKATFWQTRADYARPAVNATLSYASRTAYFIDDVDFKDEGGGVQSWTRLWATVPASWSETEDYAYSFPGFVASMAWGTICSLTGIAANGANYVCNTNATGINVADTVYLDANYVRSAQNYHVTFGTPALAVNSGVDITIAGVLPGSNVFSGVTGSIRRGNSGRSVAEVLTVNSRVLNDYALTSESAVNTDLPIIEPLMPTSYGFGSTGSKQTFLTASTVPSVSTYISMIGAGTEFVAEPSTRARYLGNIWVRRTRLVQAR